LSQKEQPFLTVVVPAYNEHERLGPTLARIADYLGTQDYHWQVIVVSDGSTDGTNDLVKVLAESEPRITLLAYSPNQGKGAAVRTGFLAAHSEWVLLSDADLATPIEEVEKLLAATQSGTPIAIGSRPLKDSNLEIRQPWYREFLGRAFNLAVQTLGIRGIADTQCGFKLFRTDVAQDIFRRCKVNGFGYDFESLMIARDLGFPIAEVPIRWQHRDGSKVNVVRDGLRMLSDLVKLRLAGKERRLKPNPEHPAP
jgi:dolichyl-phosphate beta-glucosyltransferase